MQYLETLRLLTDGSFANLRHSGRSRPRQAPGIPADTVSKARAAFDAVLPAHLTVVLAQCKLAEREWTDEQTAFVSGADGASPITSYNQAADVYRTVFTRVALDRIAALRDVTPDQRKLLFEHTGTFPELMLGLVGRSWITEIDPYLTPKLMRQIDRETRWRNSAPFWIEALVKINSDRSWAALECLLVESWQLRLTVYDAVKDLPNRQRELDLTLSNAWRAYLEESTRGNRAIFGAIAARHGVTDALVELAIYVQKWWAKAPPPKASAALLALVDGNFGDAKAAADFVTKHKKHLTFNPASRTYSLGAPAR